MKSHNEFHNSRFLRRFTALLTSLSLCLTQVLFFPTPLEAETFPAWDGTPSTSASATLQKMAVPPGLGIVQEIYDGGSGRVVVYIQDAHDIPDAQRSIQKLLEFIQDQWGVGTTAFEGVEGKLDPTLLRQFPDAEALRRVIESYLAKGELSGVSAASILNKTDGEFIGVEKQEVYEEGVSAYLRALQKKPALKTRLETIQEELASLKNKVYSKEAKELDNALQAWRREASGFSKFPVFLFSKRKPDPKRHPTLFKFHQALEAENGREPERDRQIKIFAERIKNKTLLPQDSRSFNEKFQAYRTEQLGVEEFVRFLRDVAAKQGAELPSLLKEEGDGAFTDLNGKELLRELNELADEYKKQVFTSAEEKELEEADRQISRLEKLMQLELAPEEWAELKEAKAKQPLPASFPSLNRSLADIYQALDSEFSDFLHFYETAHRRDEIFFEKIKAILQKKKNPVIGLVSGGFHTEGLTGAFRREGISYILIAPAIKEIPEASPYIEHMQGKVSWRSYFRSKNGRIRLDEAFTRASIDGLLQTEGVSESGPTLKLWRDRVLQRLAAARRLHQSFRYTRFLDEAAMNRADPSQLESLKETWSAKLEKFLSSLIKLEKKNEINEASIANLLNVGMTATPYSNPLRPSFSIPESWLRPGLRPENRAEVSIAQAAEMPASTPVAKTSWRILLREIFIALSMAAIFISFNSFIYLPLTSGWIDASPLHIIPGSMPIAILGALTGGIISQRLERNIIYRDHRTYDLAKIFRQIVFSIFFAAPIYGFFVTGWALRFIPALGFISASVVQALLNQLVFSPFVYEPVNYLIAKLVIEREDYQEAVQGVRKNLLSYYVAALVVWLPAMMLALSFSNPVVTYFVLVSTGLIWTIVSLMLIKLQNINLFHPRIFSIAPFRALQSFINLSILGIYGLSLAYWLFVGEITRLMYVFQPDFRITTAIAGAAGAAWVVALARSKSLIVPVSPATRSEMRRNRFSPPKKKKKGRVLKKDEISPEMVAMLDQIARRNLWIQTQMIALGNAKRTPIKIGGHQASSASALQLVLGAIVTSDGEDHVGHKPQSSPAAHSYQYQLDRLPEEALYHFRDTHVPYPGEHLKRSLDEMSRRARQQARRIMAAFHAPDEKRIPFKGLQAYPSMKDPNITMPTASVGIGPANAIYLAYHQKILKAKGFDVPNSHFISIVGRAEMDEDNVQAALEEAVKQHLNNVIIVVDDNDLSLDGPESASDAANLRRKFAGWEVIDLKWGSAIENIDSRSGVVFRQILGSLEPKEYLELIRTETNVREYLLARATEDQQKELEHLFSLADEKRLKFLVRDLGGHDFAKVIPAFRKARRSQKRPVVIIAHTIKGWGLEPLIGHFDNHSKLLKPADLEKINLRAELGIPEEVDFPRLDAASEAGILLRETAERLKLEEAQYQQKLARNREPMQRILATEPISDRLVPKGAIANTSVISTQAYMGQIIGMISRISNSPLEQLSSEERWIKAVTPIVTVSPDVATTTGLGSSDNDDHVRMSITEQNAVNFAGAAGKSDPFFGISTLPIVSIYDFFLFPRATDIINAMQIWGSRFWMIGTPSGSTLHSEGGAHQYGISPVIAKDTPNIIDWQPSFADELQYYSNESLRRSAQNDDEGRRIPYFRLSTLPIDKRILWKWLKAQKANEGRDEEAIRKAWSKNALKGGYRLIDYRGYEGYDPRKNVVNIFTTGTMTQEAIAASEELLKQGLFANIIVVTSATLLIGALGYRDEYSHLKQLVPFFERQAAAVSVADATPSYLADIGGILGIPVENLGLRVNGISTRELGEIYRYHGIDRANIGVKAIGALDKRKMLRRVRRQLAKRQEMRIDTQNTPYIAERDKDLLSYYEALLDRYRLELFDSTGKIKYGKDFAPFKLHFNLILYPHGTTDANKRGVMHGQVDGRKENLLNSEGRQQAFEGGLSLKKMIEKKHWPLSELVFLRSPLARTLETSEESLQHLRELNGGREITAGIELRTIEIGFGEWDGKTVEEIKAAFSEEEAAWAVAYQALNAFARSPSGESFLMFLDRVYGLLNFLNEKYAGKTVVLYGHGTLSAAIKVLLKTPDIDPHDYIEWRHSVVPPRGQPTLFSGSRNEMREDGLDDTEDDYLDIQAAAQRAFVEPVRRAEQIRKQLRNVEIYLARTEKIQPSQFNIRHLIFGGFQIGWGVFFAYNHPEDAGFWLFAGLITSLPFFFGSAIQRLIKRTGISQARDERERLRREIFGWWYAAPSEDLTAGRILQVRDLVVNYDQNFAAFISALYEFESTPRTPATMEKTATALKQLMLNVASTLEAQELRPGDIRTVIVKDQPEIEKRISNFIQAHLNTKRSEMRSRQRPSAKLPANNHSANLERKTMRYFELWEQYQKAKEGDLHAFYYVLQRLHMDLLKTKKRGDGPRVQRKLDIFISYVRELLHVEKLQEGLIKDSENHAKLLDLLIELYRDEELQALDGSHGPNDRYRLLSVIYHFGTKETIDFLFIELEMHLMGQGRPVSGGKESIVRILYTMGKTNPFVLLRLKSRIEELLERRKDPSGWEARHLKLPRRRKNFQAVEDRAKDTIDGHLVEYAKVLVDIASARSGLLMVPLLVRMTAREMPWWLRDQTLHQLETYHRFGRILRENYSHPGQPNPFPDDESFALHLIERLRQEKHPLRQEAILGALDALALLGVKSAFQEGNNRAFLYSALKEKLSSTTVRYRYLMPAVAARENIDFLFHFFRGENPWARQTAAAGLAVLSRDMQLSDLADFQTLLLRQFLKPEEDEIGRLWALEALVTLMKNGDLLPEKPAALSRRAAHWIFREGEAWFTNEVERLQLVRQLDPEFSRRVFENGSWKDRSAILSAIQIWPGFASPGWDIKSYASSMEFLIERKFASPRPPKTADAYLYAERVYKQLLELTVDPDKVAPSSGPALIAKLEAFTELVLDIENEVTKLFMEDPNRPPFEVFNHVYWFSRQRRSDLSRDQQIYFQLALLRMIRDMVAMRSIRKKAWELGLMKNLNDLEFSNIKSVILAWDAKDGKEDRAGFLKDILGFVPTTFHLQFFPTSFHVTLDQHSYERLNKLREYGYDFGVENLTLEEAHLASTIPGSAGVYYSGFTFRFRDEEHSGIRSFQTAQLHLNEKPEKWVEQHEEAHLRFHRFGTDALLHELTRDRLTFVKPIVNDLEEFLIERGVKDPDLRASLFYLVSELFLAFQNEIRSRFADGRHFGPLEFQRWFDFYLTGYEERWIKDYLPRIQGPVVFGQMMDRLRNGDFRSWISAITYALNNVRNQKFKQEFKEPLEMINDGQLPSQKARRWMEVYSTAVPITYTKLLWAVGQNGQVTGRQEMRRDEETGLHPEDILQAFQTGSEDDLKAIVLEIRESFKRKAAMGDTALFEKYEVLIARGQINDWHIFRLRTRGLPERHFDILLKRVWSERLDKIFSSQDPWAEFNRFLENFRYEASDEMIQHFTRALAFYLYYTSSRRPYMSQKVGSIPWPRDAYPGRRKILNRYREFLENKGLGTAGLKASLREVRKEVNEFIQLEQDTAEYAGPALQLGDPAHKRLVEDIRELANSGRFEEIMARHGGDTEALEAYIRSLAVAPVTQGYGPALTVLQQLTVAGLPASMTKFGLKAVVMIHFSTLLLEDEEFLLSLAARGALERGIVIDVLKNQNSPFGDEKAAVSKFRRRLIKLIIDEIHRPEMRETREQTEQRYKFLTFIAGKILEGKDDTYLRKLLPDIWPRALRPVRVKQYLDAAWEIAELEAPEKTPVIRPSRPAGDLMSPKEFSPEVKTIFEKLEIKAIGDLLQYTAEELATIGLSKKGIKEVQSALWRFRLKLKNDDGQPVLKKPVTAKKKKSAMKIAPKRKTVKTPRNIKNWPVQKLAEPGKFSQRILKTFKILKIKTVKDLLKHRPSSLLGVKGFKKQSLKEVVFVLKRHGLSLRSENRTKITVLEDLFGIREAPRSELRAFTQAVRERGAAAVGEELRGLFDRRIGQFMAQSLLGPSAFAQEENSAAGREKLAMVGMQFLDKFEADARQFLTAHPGSRLEFNFALPYIEQPDFKEWLAGLLNKINTLRSSLDQPSRIRVQIRLLTPTTEQEVRAFIASLDLEDEIKRGIEPVIDDFAAARVLNTFLQTHPNALAFSLSPSLEKSILHQLQLIHYEEGDLFADTYPLAADILLEAAKLSEEITAEFLAKLRLQFPEEAVRFRQNRLEVRSFARQWILEAAARRLFATMA